MSDLATSTLTLKLRGVEAALLEELVESGLHHTKAEALRSSLIQYGLSLGLLGRHELWERLKQRQRGVSPEALKKELELASDPEVMADLAESRRQFEAGKSRPIEELDLDDL